MQMRRRLDAVSEVEELSDRNLRFQRIIFPFGDCVGDVIVEMEEILLDGDKGSDPPETFRSAKNRPTAIDSSTIRVMFENGAPVLHHEHRDTPFAF